MLYWIGGVLAICMLLATFADRVPRAVIVSILVVCAVAILAVRLHHEGPYPLPRGLDLAALTANLGLALLVLLSKPSAARRGSLLLRAAFFIAPIVLLLGIVAVLHESEEVVVLRTFDERGGVLETRLWVVDYDGAPWLLTGSDGRHTQRLETHPQVELFRQGTLRCYRAVPFRDRATLEKILLVRGEKYAVQRIGLTIGFDRLFRSRERPLETYAVAIRLDPC